MGDWKQWFGDHGCLVFLALGVAVLLFATVHIVSKILRRIFDSFKTFRENWGRSYFPSLRAGDERIFLDEVIKFISSHEVTFNTHGCVFGNYEVWTRNSPYADMDFVKPMEVRLSGVGANRLRKVLLSKANDG